jgi:hypothetical protein
VRPAQDPSPPVTIARLEISDRLLGRARRLFRNESVSCVELQFAIEQSDRLSTNDTDRN